MTYGTLQGGYPGSSKLLHWLVALCVIVTIPVAIAMGRVSPGPLQDTLYNLHKSLGVLILILMVLRIINRFVVGSPAPEPSLTRAERAMSSAVHGLLYVLLIGMALGGWAANSAYGASTPFFGLFDLPPILAKNEALSEKIFFAHRWIGYAVGALAAAHIAAALQHYVIKRDGVLQRMLP